MVVHLSSARKSLNCEPGRRSPRIAPPVFGVAGPGVQAGISRKAGISPKAGLCRKSQVFRVLGRLCGGGLRPGLLRKVMRKAVTWCFMRKASSLIRRGLAGRPKHLDFGAKRSKMRAVNGAVRGCERCGFIALGALTASCKLRKLQKFAFKSPVPHAHEWNTEPKEVQIPRCRPGVGNQAVSRASNF